MRLLYLISKCVIFNPTCAINNVRIKLFIRNYGQALHEQRQTKDVHPYKCIHPWKSLTEFSEAIHSNIIYNEGGLIAINKPYGIARSKTEFDRSYVANCVSYTLEDAIPYICNKLQYPTLIIVRSPEKYMSGVVLLAADMKIQRAIEVSIIRSNWLSNNYLAITLEAPKKLCDENRLAMKLIRDNKSQKSRAVIIRSWSKNDEKFRRIKLLKTKYKLLSLSPHHSCSLLEMSSSTNRWHALRLFAATFLYSPILGDDSCAVQVQKVGNAYVKVNPFIAHSPPKLDKHLLLLLNVSLVEQNIIPCHIHLRSVVLPYFFNKTITIEAPLPEYFKWTCERLKFKNLMQDNAEHLSCT